jgi:hypothetical protein
MRWWEQEIRLEYVFGVHFVCVIKFHLACVLFVVDGGRMENATYVGYKRHQYPYWRRGK